MDSQLYIGVYKKINNLSITTIIKLKNLASSLGFREIAELLVNKDVCKINEKDNSGDTALHIGKFFRYFKKEFINLHLQY